WYSLALSISDEQLEIPNLSSRQGLTLRRGPQWNLTTVEASELSTDAINYLSRHAPISGKLASLDRYQSGVAFHDSVLSRNRTWSSVISRGEQRPQACPGRNDIYRLQPGVRKQRVSGTE